jgi:PAS domain-containing protein
MNRSTRDKPRSPALGSLLLCCWALALFSLSIGLNIRNSRSASFLIYSLVLSIGVVLFLQLLYWHRERKRRILLDHEAYAREREFASVFEHTLDGILILDDQATCRAANPAALRLLRVETRSLAGCNFAHFHSDPAQFAPRWKAFLCSGYERGQMQLVCPDQSSLFVEFTATANYVPGRHILILCDTTRQKDAETSLQNAEERFRQMADHIQEIFWMMDADSKKLVYVNRAFETLTGRARSTLGDDPLS